MKLTYEQAAKLFELAKQKRSPREARFDQAFKYSMPARGSFFDGDPSKRIDDVFDETAIVCTQEFASRFQSAMTPNHSRWASLEAGPDVPPAERDAVNKSLDLITETVFEVIHGSNFSQESYEAYLDMSVSMGAIEVTEGDALTPIVNTAIPITQLWVLNGPRDQLDIFFRLQKKKISDVEVLYRDHTIPKDKLTEAKEKDQEMTLLILTRRDYDEAATEVHHRHVFWLEEKMEIWFKEYRGTGSSPIIAFRWAKCSDDDWGTGPTLNVLPAIKTCNLVVEMILENAQMAISGMYNVEDDGVVNPDTIEILPGTLVPHAPGSQGLRPVEQAGDFRVADIVLGEQRNNIKRGLYNDMLGNPNKTPMSATEVAQRMEDLSRQIGSAFGRVWSEFCVRYLQRVIFILKQRGMITLPTVNGRVVKISAKSPLAQAQNQIDIQNIDRLTQFSMQSFGPQMTNIFLKGEDILPYVAEKLQVPGNLVRNKIEMQKMIEQVQQLAASAQGQPQEPPPNA